MVEERLLERRTESDGEARLRMFHRVVEGRKAMVLGGTHVTNSSGVNQAALQTVGEIVLGLQVVALRDMDDLAKTDTRVTSAVAAEKTPGSIEMELSTGVKGDLVTAGKMLGVEKKVVVGTHGKSIVRAGILGITGRGDRLPLRVMRAVIGKTMEDGVRIATGEAAVGMKVGNVGDIVTTMTVTVEQQKAGVGTVTTVILTGDLMKNGGSGENMDEEATPKRRMTSLVKSTRKVGGGRGPAVR